MWRKKQTVNRNKLLLQGFHYLRASTIQMESSKHGEFNTLILEIQIYNICVVLNEMGILKLDSFDFISFNMKQLKLT